MNSTICRCIALGFLLCSQAWSVNVVINAAGVATNRLVIPIPEQSGVFSPTRQKCTLKLYAKNNFTGELMVSACDKNGQPTENIKFYEKATGDARVESSASLQNFKLKISGGKFEHGNKQPGAETTDDYQASKERTMYVEGLVESENTIDLKLYENGKSDPVYDPTPDKDFSVVVVKVGMREVIFADDTPLCSDDKNLLVQPGKPQWKDNDGDGAFTPGERYAEADEHNYSISYVRASTPSIGGKVKIAKAATLGVIKIKAIASDGNPGPIELAPGADSAAVDPADANAVKLAPAACNNKWPDQIRFYDRDGADSNYPAFVLSWSVQVDGGEWAPYAKTKHQVYLTWKTPNANILVSNQETVYYLACHGAHGLGMSSNNDEIVSDIFNHEISLEGNNVNRTIGKIDSFTGNVMKNPTNGENINLKYDECDTDANGKIIPNKDMPESTTDMCDGWAMFFRRINAVHGISVPRIGLKVSEGKNSTFIVKTQNITKKNGIYIAKDNMMAKGQGKVIKTGVWTQHVINSFNGKYYDPAYGVFATSREEYENKSIQAYIIQSINDDGFIASERKVDRIDGMGSLLNYTPKDQD